MTGMDHAVQVDNPIVVTAFHHALAIQFLVVGALIVVLAIAWIAARAVALRDAVPAATTTAARAAASRMGEPPARLVLRVAFGSFWVLDGFLQLQSAMPLGLPTGVLEPAASGAPSWVQQVVSFGATLWADHPITAAVATVWIQLGLGIFLLVAPRGLWSRGAGLVSAGWGLAVWSVGEAFGGIFTPGASWLFGLPGAALFYAVAGLLIAFPETAWRGARLGRWLLRGLGGLFVVMAIVQAWPGRGTWSGQATAHAPAGAITAMAQAMSQVSQPSPLADLVRSFGSLDAAHGVAVNLFFVLALLAIGGCLLSGRRRPALVGVVAGTALCVVTWVLVQDFGFFGGVGTDPNSMLPTATLLVVGYLSLRGASAPAVAAATAPPAVAPVAREPALVGALATSAPSDAPGVPAPIPSPMRLLQVLAAVCAAAIVLLGAAPMAVASLGGGADPTLAEAINGTPEHADFRAFPFALMDEHGRRVTMAQLRGRVVVLTFLDPVCTTDCPSSPRSCIARTASSAPRRQGRVRHDQRKPDVPSTSALLAFDQHEDLSPRPTGPTYGLAVVARRPVDRLRRERRRGAAARWRPMRTSSS